MAAMAHEAPGTITVRAEFPTKFKPLLEQKARYKVFYGGRNGAKSWQIARSLLLRGLAGKFRVLCTREVQSSLKDSVKKLLEDQIALLGLGGFYSSVKDEIRGPDGTLFLFKGLQDPEALKSAEGVDVCWIEEARTVTETSWKKLEPTIRKPGAEIWISFNPELTGDYLYKLFVTGTPPPRSIVVKVGYQDNPWLNPEIKEQIDHLRESDYDEYLWVYGGHCRVALEGAVYAKQLRQVKAENRICKVPHRSGKPVHLFLDLGRGDMTAIWFVQIVGLEYRLLHYYQNNGEDFDHYIEHLNDLANERGWNYGTMWLPHDAEHEHLSAKRTIKQQAQDAGFRVRMVPNIKIGDGIAAARAIFPNCWFDAEGCADGIACLQQYHYEVDEDGTRSKLPEHDWSSHGADGFRYMGVALKDDAPKPKAKAPVMRPRPTSRHGWLAR
jgi:phage terminase large subunit